MKKIFLYAALSLIQINCLIASPGFKDHNRIQQVLPTDKGKDVLLQLRNPNKDQYEYQLSLLAADMKSIKSLPLKNNLPFIVVWGPKPNELTYVEANGNDSKINVINILTQQTHLLVSISGQIAHLQYSPSFSKLAIVLSPEKSNADYYFEGEAKPRQRLVIYNLNNKKVLKMLTENVSIVNAMQWFRDEQRLLIQTQPSQAYFDSWHGTVGILDISKNSFAPISNNNALNENPILSANELYIAYLTNDLPEQDRPKVFQFKRIELYDLVKKTTRRLPETYDGAPSLIAFASNDESILYTEAKNGFVALNEIRIKPPYQQQSLSSNPGMIRDINLNHDGHWLGYTTENPTTAPTACLIQLSNLQIMCIPQEQELMDIKYEVIHYPSFDGKEIQAFLVTPKNASLPLPTIILAHGGPTYHSFQGYLGFPYSLGLPIVPADYARKGYAILMPNIRGSIGYGPDFRMGNINDVGGADFKDLLAGVNYLVAKKISDEHKLGIFGWSYGGFLCEFAATQTNMFKAAVCGAAISDWISHDATSEFKAYTSGYFGNTYSRDFTKPNLLLEKSPALQFKYHGTPILLLHGTIDRAVHFSQSLEFYWAYKKAGGITRLAAFPGEDHGFVKHESIEKGIELTNTWFDQYLK